MVITEENIGQMSAQTTQQELIHTLESNLDLITDTTSLLYDEDEQLIEEIVGIYLNANPLLDPKYLKKSLYVSLQNHEGQFRDSGHPAVTHPFHVGYILSEWKFNNTVVAIGNQHDGVEDNKDEKRVDAARKIDSLGHEVLIGVTGLSKPTPILDRKDLVTEETYQQLQRFIDEYPELRLDYVKIADVFSNLYTKEFMGAKNGLTAEQHQQQYCEKARRYALPLAIDVSGTLEMRLVPYIKELISR